MRCFARSAVNRVLWCDSYGSFEGHTPCIKQWLHVWTNSRASVGGRAQPSTARLLNEFYNVFPAWLPLHHKTFRNHFRERAEPPVNQVLSRVHCRLTYWLSLDAKLGDSQCWLKWAHQRCELCQLSIHLKVFWKCFASFLMQVIVAYARCKSVEST